MSRILKARVMSRKKSIRYELALEIVIREAEQTIQAQDELIVECMDVMKKKHRKRIFKDYVPSK